MTNLSASDAPYSDDLTSLQSRDHSTPRSTSGPSTGGGSDPLPRRMDFDMLVSDLAVRVCQGSTLRGGAGGGLAKIDRVPKSADDLVKLVACHMVGFFIVIQKTTRLYRLIAPTVEGLLRAGVLVERDGAIRVGQEDRT